MLKPSSFDNRRLSLTLIFCLTTALLLGSISNSEGADFQKGWDAYKNEDYAVALREWQPLAEEGDDQAQNFLGLLYYDYESLLYYDYERKGAKHYVYERKGVTPDYKTAVKWFTLSAEQGFEEAQHRLAIMYKNGRGITQDYKTAVKWFTLSAEQGYAKAQNRLGGMYIRGQGVTKDYKTAVKWFTLAAEQGDDQGQNNLGAMNENGQGITQDYKTAVKWYTLAAEQGEPNAQNNLGRMYKDGKGVTQDYVYAHMWFNILASSGDEFVVKYGIKRRDALAEKMTSADISAAQALARECVRKEYKGC